MTNVALPERPTEATRLSIPDAEPAPTPDSACKLKRTRYLTFSLVSSVIILILASIFLVLLEFGFIPQTKLGFYCKDPVISKPFTGDTISWPVLLTGSFLGSLIIFAVIEYDLENSFSKACCRRIWQWYRDFVIGITLNVLIIETIKTIVGEHRPHFIHTCVPDKDETCEAGTFVSDYICTNTRYSRYFEIDSSRSFPSGHASVSVYTALFCAAFISCRLPVRRTGIVFKVFVMFLCIVWGLVCSLTRITDFRHHWWDVLFGALVGVVTVFYTVKWLCGNFETPWCEPKPQKPAPSASTTALLDMKNKDATSVII